jgi:hypothetical protein
MLPFIEAIYGAIMGRKPRSRLPLKVLSNLFEILVSAYQHIGPLLEDLLMPLVSTRVDVAVFMHFLRHVCPLGCLGFPCAVVDDRGAIPGLRLVFVVLRICC